jgi:hypothetical protein
MREQTVNEQRINCDYDEGGNAGDEQGCLDRNALVDGIRVLDVYVSQREMLVIGFDGIENVETSNATAIVRLSVNDFNGLRAKGKEIRT